MRRVILDSSALDYLTATAFLKSIDPILSRIERSPERASQSLRYPRNLSTSKGWSIVNYKGEKLLFPLNGDPESVSPEVRGPRYRSVENQGIAVFDLLQ